MQVTRPVLGVTTPRYLAPAIDYGGRAQHQSYYGSHAPKRGPDVSSRDLVDATCPCIPILMQAASHCRCLHLLLYVLKAVSEACPEAWFCPSITGVFRLISNQLGAGLAYPCRRRFCCTCSEGWGPCQGLPGEVTTACSPWRMHTAANHLESLSLVRLPMLMAQNASGHCYHRVRTPSCSNARAPCDTTGPGSSPVPSCAKV